MFAGFALSLMLISQAYKHYISGLSELVISYQKYVILGAKKLEIHLLFLE